MTNVLVLGGNGMVGRRLIPLLREADLRVRTAGRSQGSDVRFDWADFGAGPSPFDGVDALYLVPPPMVYDPFDLVRTFLDEARAAGIRKVVAISSLGVTFPTEPDASPRRKLEDAVIESGLDWTLLRPSGFMQNFSEGFAAPMIRQGVVVAAADDGEVAFVDAGDIAAVAAEAFKRADLSGQRIALTGPATLSFRDAVASVSAAAGRSIQYLPVDEPRMRELMVGGGVPADFAEVLLGDQRAIREGSAAVLLTSIADVLGRPARNFDEFASGSSDAWRS